MKLINLTPLTRYQSLRKVKKERELRILTGKMKKPSYEDF